MVEQGFRMLSVGMDSGLLLRGVKGALAAFGIERQIRTSLAGEGPE